MCEIDHTVPYPAGSTSPGNVKQYCRTYHLVKTFYCGPGGWSERQLADGTMLFASPTGHRYMTEPAGAQLFPAFSAHRGLEMPTRKRTRDEDRRARIEQERHVRARDAGG